LLIRTQEIIPDKAALSSKAIKLRGSYYEVLGCFGHHDLTC